MGMAHVIIFGDLLVFKSEIYFFEDFLTKIALAGAILLVTWIFSKMLASALFKTVSRFGQQAAQQIKRAVSWLVWFIGILVLLNQLGLKLEILLVILILGGIMLIVALRDVLLNIAARETITVYSPFKIGDWIQVDEHFGRVVDINPINTVLVTLDNEVIHVPNSKIVNSVFVNRTTPQGVRIHVPLTLDSSLDLSKAEEIIMEIGREFKEELAPDSEPEVRVVNMNNNKIRLELLLRINNPAKSRFIASEILKKVKMKLDEVQRGKRSLKSKK
jgi:small-conductance mechanosensitive channel